MGHLSAVGPYGNALRMVLTRFVSVLENFIAARSTVQYVEMI